MPSRISSPSSDPSALQTVCTDEPSARTQVEAARSRPTPARMTADSIAAWRADVERTFATRELSPGEQALSGRVRTLRPGDLLTCEVSGKLSAEFHLEAAAKARVERMEDGTYKVQLLLDAAVGEGADSVEALALTGQATYTFTLQTHEGVADLLQGAGQLALLEGTAAALSPQGFVTQLPLALLRASDDSADRLAHYVRNHTEAVGLEAGGKFELGKKQKHDNTFTLGFNKDFAKAGIEIAGTVGAEFRPHTREIVLEAKVKGEGAASIAHPVLEAIKLSGKAQAEVKARATIQLSGREFDELASGSTSVTALAHRLAQRADYVVVVEAAGSADAATAVGGLAGTVKLQTTLRPSQYLEAMALPGQIPALMDQLSWTGTLHGGRELEVASGGFDLKGVEAGYTFKILRLQARETGSLSEVLSSVRRCSVSLATGGSDPTQCEVEARSAVARLSK